MIQAIIPYKEYATITRRTLFIHIWRENNKNIFSEWCQSVRQLRTDGGPRPFLKLQNITFIDKAQHFSASQATQAKIYFKQKKYKKAIDAFKILSLKYPEKNAFFADQIKRVRILQKNKS